MRRFVYIFLAFMMVGTAYANLDLFDDIASGISSGSAKEVSKYMNSNVDLTILNQEDVYSKAQAEVILKDFFSKNPPKSFNVIHQGTSKEGAKYAIGNYMTTAGKSFRVYIFVKQSAGSFLIHELRFETQ